MQHVLDMGLLTPTSAALITRTAALAGGALATRPSTLVDLDSGETLVSGQLTVNVQQLRRAIKRLSHKPAAQRRRAATALAASRLGLNRGQYSVRIQGGSSLQVYEGQVPTPWNVRLSPRQGGLMATVYEGTMHDLTEAPLRGYGKDAASAIASALRSQAPVTRTEPEPADLYF